MNFEIFKKEYNERYNNECYKNDDGAQNVLALINAAENLSDAAKREFIKAFKTGFEFALDGELYLGGGKNAAMASYPNLVDEAKNAGIKVVTRKGDL